MRREFRGAAVPTTLAAAISDTDTQFELADATGWPTGVIGPFSTVLHGGVQGQEEKVLCSSRTGSIVTILERGYDETTPLAHSLPCKAIHNLDAKAVDEMNAFINNGAHKGFVDATADINAARPAGFASVEWMVLTTQDAPTNMANNDTLLVVPA